MTNKAKTTPDKAEQGAFSAADAKLIAAIAKANGHPDPASYVAQVEAAYSEPDEAKASDSP